MLQPSSSPRAAFRDLKRARGIVDIFFLEEVYTFIFYYQVFSLFLRYFYSKNWFVIRLN